MARQQDRRLKSTTENYQRVKSLYSLENGSATYNPKITVNYINVTGSASVTAGPVNSSTGNVTLNWTAGGLSGGTYQVCLLINGVRQYYDVGAVTSTTISGVPCTATSAFIRYNQGGSWAGDTHWIDFTMPDTVSPQFPGGNATAAVPSQYVNVFWPAASDNTGVTHYEVYWYQGSLSQVTTDSSGKITSISGQRNHVENTSELNASYDYRAKGFPSGETIYFGIWAIDAKGNYTTVPCYSNAVTIPNYITPQAPSSLTGKEPGGGQLW